MGLDMYLSRRRKTNFSEEKQRILLEAVEPDNFTGDLKISVMNLATQRGVDFEDDELETIKEVEGDLTQPWSLFPQWFSTSEEVGYWRKANQIHAWFVENIQDGIDECQEAVASKEKLEELRDLCKEVIEGANLVEGKVVNGYTFSGGKKIPNYEEGKTITNPEFCDERLPTQAGFFFGGTGYDQWYIQDLEHTVEILDKVLDETDFETYEIVYQSSW